MTVSEPCQNANGAPPPRSYPVVNNLYNIGGTINCEYGVSRGAVVPGTTMTFD